MNKNGIENLNEQRDASSHLEQSLEKFNLSRSESTELESLVKQQDTTSNIDDGSERVSGNEAKEKQTANADLDPRINKGVNRREGVHPSFGAGCGKYCAKCNCDSSDAPPLTPSSK